MIVYNQVRHWIWVRRPQLWVADGNEKGSHAPFRATYAGSEPCKNYFFQMALEQGYGEKPLGPLWYKSLSSLSRRSGCSLLVLEACKSRQNVFESRNAIKIPVWQGMELDLSRREALYDKKKFKGMEKKVLKSGFRAQWSRKERDLRDFYFNMCLPYLRSRHMDAAFLRDYEDIRSRFYSLSWELLLIFKEDCPIAGSIVEHAGARFRGMFMGILNASQEYLRLGAGDAVYYFEILKALEMGLPRYHMGYCRAFLRDGVMQYKSYLGGHLIPEHEMEAGFLILRVLRDDPATRSFFIQNPFVLIDDLQHYRIAVVRENRDAASPVPELERIAEYKGALDLKDYDGEQFFKKFDFPEPARSRLPALGRVPAAPGFPV